MLYLQLTFDLKSKARRVHITLHYSLDITLPATTTAAGGRGEISPEGILFFPATSPPAARTRWKVNFRHTVPNCKMLFVCIPTLHSLSQPLRRRLWPRMSLES